MNQVPAPRINPRGFPAGPWLYPKLLRQAADLIEAITAFEQPDPDRQESTSFVSPTSLALYDEEGLADDDPVAGLRGWVCYLDTACWVFIPYVAAIERDLATEDGQGGLTRQSPMGRLVADVPALLAEVERLRNVADLAAKVMATLAEYGPGIVGHLLDTDENDGERLRVALAAAADVPQPEHEDERDPADYGPVDGNEARPDETTCRNCGRSAIDHTRGRFSIYGVCPVGPQPADPPSDDDSDFGFPLSYGDYQ